MRLGDKRVLAVLLGTLAVATFLLRGKLERALVNAFTQLRLPSQPFDPATAPSPPDYSSDEHWAALPMRNDAATAVPANSGFVDNQATAAADVFFVHPTTYFTAARWNAALDDPVVNVLTDEGSIKLQASVFNGGARIYAPRYRQATAGAFVTSCDDADAAIEFAYGDIRSAFEHYLDHHNQGRPILIASHSQGSWHALRLLEEYFAGRSLSNRLVAAYLIGMPVPMDKFSRTLVGIAPADAPEQTCCLISWNTVARGGNPAAMGGSAKIHYPEGYECARDKELLCVNPLTWRRDDTYAPRELNLGGVLLTPIGTLGPLDPHICDAQCQRGILWINRPRDGKYNLVVFPGRSYHGLDYSLFYANIRENVRTRVEAYLRSQQASAA